MRNIVTLVLGGGRGTRLYPLTKFRSKPAVPVGGKYRLIDIPLSNCINSGLNRIYVVTQFNSVSLHRHIRSTYNFDPFDGGFVEILAAQQTNTSADWYQGTADAVRQNLRYTQQAGIDRVLILSGDQLYRMDFRAMIATHERSGADVTIAAVPVHSKDASGLGIMRLDETGRVIGFLEKPQTEQELAHVRTSPEWIDAHGIPSHGRDCLANMGIYLFNRNTLLDVLQKTDYRDFGREVFPVSIRTRRVQVHLFDGYWEDIGTIKSFYEANLGLANKEAAFPLTTANAPVYSRPRFLPPTRLEGATVRHSLIADGCVIEQGAVIENSVIGLRCLIGRDAVIRNSVIMGNDYYELPGEIASRRCNGCPPLGIGPGTFVEGAIIDKNCRIGCGARVVNAARLENTEEDQFGMIRDGVLVIPKETTLPDKWALNG
jgi:glucose-1-phosphate adenylyltransferase